MATEYVTGAPIDSIPAIEEIHTIEVSVVFAFRVLSITLVALKKFSWKVFCHSLWFSLPGSTELPFPTLQTRISIDPQWSIALLINFFESLEENEDVQNIYSNVEFTK